MGAGVPHAELLYMPKIMSSLFQKTVQNMPKHISETHLQPTYLFGCRNILSL